MIITVDNIQYDVPEAVANKLAEYREAMEGNYASATMLHRRLTVIENKLSAFKAATLKAKVFSTKLNKLEVWEKRNELFKLIK